MENYSWKQTYLVLVVMLLKTTGLVANNFTDVNSTSTSTSTSASTSAQTTTSVTMTTSAMPAMRSPSNCQSGEYTSTGECCDKCPVGFGVHRQCSDLNSTNTICVLCEPEVTFSAVASHVDECQLCRRCEHNEVMTSVCNPTQDTVCECAPDYFRNGAQTSGGAVRSPPSSCSQCMICPPGFGATVPCSPLQNSVCQLCENGTYSDIISSTDNCKPCTVCGEKSSVEKPCTRFSDTVCTENNLPTLTYKPRDVGNATVPWDHGSNRGPSESSVVPIFCSILGAVIFGLLAYVVFKKWSFKKMKLRQAQKMTRSNSCHTDIEANTISVLTAKNGQGFQSCDSVVFGNSRQPLMAVPSTTPYQHLPLEKQSELERALCASRIDGRDWRGLARELGFTDVDIMRFVSNPKSPTSPAHTMLSAWQKKDSKRATVGALVEALRRIRRNDVADLIPMFTYSAYQFQNS